MFPLYLPDQRIRTNAIAETDVIT